MFSTFSTNQLMRYGCLIVICLAAILVLATDRSDSFLPQYGLTKSSLPNAGPVGTCNKSGTYTQYKSLQSNGTVSMHWSPSLPLTNEFGYMIRVNGYGWLDASISHAVTSPRFGTIGSHSESFPRTKVGSFYVILLVPRASAVTEQTVGDKVTASYNNEGYDTYSWTASGTVSLQAVYWKVTAGYPFMGGSWENLGSAVPYTYNSQGSWTLTGKLLCPKCSQEVSHFSKHRNSCSRIDYQRNSRRRNDATLKGCNAIFWECDSAAVAKHAPKTCSKPGCNGKYRTCANIGHVCRPSNTGTTTSPTVQNNGGGTVGNGGTGGTSADRVRCGHSNCQRGGYASSREAHKTTCPAGHRYYACSLGGASKHANCRARNSGEVRCAQGSYCRSGGWASSRNAHQTTCSAGHTYWSCWPLSVSRHRRH